MIKTVPAIETSTDEMQASLCGARRPGWEYGPAIGRHRLPCVRESHEGELGDHVNALGETWPPACQDCGIASGPLEGLTVAELDGTVRDGHLCPPCSARATAPVVDDQAVVDQEPGRADMTLLLQAIREISGGHVAAVAALNMAAYGLELFADGRGSAQAAAEMLAVIRSVLVAESGVVAAGR
ncbi:hypothetical protein [Streptomyces sp. NBC_01262]|uniref:hypothetical protein n=1 Tax=Streptomyces sp. NBC_01262 TaxID=2903803 RepID=UPI002E31766B|nr:hypothetical protein [Streptomyces sp. NBC_01262]